MLPAKPKAKADNTYPDLQLIQFWTSQKPNLIFVLLYIVLKKITTNTPSHRVSHCSWKACTVHATYRLVTNLHADNKPICRLCWFPELTVGSQPMRRQIWVKCIIIRFNRLTTESTQWVLQCWTDKEGVRVEQPPMCWRTYPSQDYVTCGFSLFLVITLGPRRFSPS